MEFSAEQKLEIWHRAIQTQMHFAELSIKMRQIGLTMAGGTIALAIVLYRSDLSFSFPVTGTGYFIPIASILCFSAAAILFAARLIDVGVYHQMLRGAVKFNELYEIELDAMIGWKAGLTETISAYSRFRQPALLDGRNSDGRIWIDGARGRGFASDRISWFYYLSIIALVAAGLALTWLENNAVQFL